MNHEAIFERLYEKRIWGGDITHAFPGSSGPGSDPQNAQPYIKFLKNFIREKRIQTVVDLGCGDWRIGPAIFGDEFCYYKGYDIYPKLTEFLSRTFKDPRWKFETLNCAASPQEMDTADLLLVKDVLQHWTDKEVQEFMEFQKTAKKYKYILITNCGDYLAKHTMEKAGDWRQLAPDHPLMTPYGLKEVLKYDSKVTLLFEP